MKSSFLIFCIVSLIFAGCQPEQEITQQQPEVTEQQPEPVEVASSQKSPESTQVQTETKPAEEGLAPKIVVTKAIHDFGKVGPGSANNLANYSFVNKGDAELKVTRIQSTCGCSQPTLIKDGKRYDAKTAFAPPIVFQPGEEGTVEVKFKASSSKGSVSKRLYILSDDPATARAQLTVKAEVVVKVAVSPEKIDLRFDQENAGMPDLVIKSIDDQEFSIKSAGTSRNVITIPFDPEEKAKEFVLKPEVNIEELSKFGNGVIQISTTHPQAGRLMVRYNAKPMFEVSNPRYILKNVEPETAILRDNLIKSNYGNPAEIESVESRNGYMEIVGQEPDGDHIKLSIKITPPSQQTNSRRYITDELTVILKGGHKLSIRCSGWFRLNT